ncbi:hypothetical protein HLI03_08415 [Rhizobium laguerreae]|uniref:hypothetical protein n=1 Tax=Rhizobium laguerreae TaxID=1076926 RepID=UPI001478A031|nr:hypothetical protein [Rhizobium laguerreae]NNH41718.1 hypothetical protein [Rhizobium laguerreae]NNH57291.1 hypothetical protein [Rhizobium laguerreae]
MLPAEQCFLEEGVLVYLRGHRLFAMMLLGALVAVQIPTFSDNSGSSLAMVFGSFSPILYVLIVYALLCINVFNLYGAFMAVVTTIQPLEICVLGQRSGPL